MGLGVVAMVFHEAAHIVAALALRIQVKSVGVGWRGMYTVRDAGTPDKNLLIALAGPLMNLALVLSWHWLPTFGLANLVCGVANLLPIENSDGARVQRCWRQIHKKELPGRWPCSASCLEESELLPFINRRFLGPELNRSRGGATKGKRD
jgi:hypothetical protein